MRDVGTFRAFVDFALRDAIDAGWTPGPADAVRRAPTSRRPAAAATSPGSPATSACRTTSASGSSRPGDEVRERVRALVGGGADLIKFIVTGAVLTRGTRPASSS